MKQEPQKEEKLSRKTIKNNQELYANFSSIKDNLEVSLYGATTEDDTKKLDDMFANIMKTEINGINRHTSDDVSGFISKLYSKDVKSPSPLKDGEISEIFGMESNEVFNFISNAYQNKILKQNDLKEISSQLIELREAVLVTRDAIVSPDTAEGNISRSIKFSDDSESEENDTYKSTINEIEKKFRLNYRIKNFIIPHTLTQGSYYAYIIPYRNIFANFDKKKTLDPRYQQLNSSYHEMTLYECFKESVSEDGKQTASMPSLNDFIKECAEEYFTESDNRELQQYSESERKTHLENRNACFAEGITELTKRISICNEPTPLPLLMYGESSLEEIYNHYPTHGIFTEADSEIERFKNTLNIDTGTYNDNEKKFKDIADCYLKLIDSPHMIELKIMDKVLGYYYVLEDDLKPISGVITSSLYYDKFDDLSKQRSIIDKLVNRIVSAFDKKFLNDNAEFKDLIAESLMYYDLNNKRIKFQFIPVEYVCPFKVNENEIGNGTSILEPSLFYAKLYLMLLLFKIMSIVLYSNDTRVNYVKQSGIDKNIANKIQEIARKKQERQVNIMDMFSYTTLIKKVGNGSEMYVPVGRSGERGLETEILQGQDVQLNTELMEFLRKCYILGTGVPDAIMNYLNEADFAKSIEMANTKFVSRVVSLQMDFNTSLTKLYQMLLVYSAGVSEQEAVKLSYQLQPPKSSANNVKTEMTSNAQSYLEFLKLVMFGPQADQNPDLPDVIMEFNKLVLKDYLPNIDIDHLDELLKQAKINAKEKKVDPENNNTDDIDNLDFGNQL